MFSKSLITSLFLLALTSSVNVHAAVVPPRGDVQLPSGPDGIPQNPTDGFNPAHHSRSMERAQVGESDTGNEAPRAVALPSAIHKATPAVSEGDLVEKKEDKRSKGRGGKGNKGSKGGGKGGGKGVVSSLLEPLEDLLEEKVVKRSKGRGGKGNKGSKGGGKGGGKGVVSSLLEPLEDLLEEKVVKRSKGRGGKGKKGGKSSGKGSKASAAAKEKRFWSSRSLDSLE